MKLLSNSILLTLILSVVFFIPQNTTEVLSSKEKIVKNPEKGIWEGKRKIVFEEVLSIGVKEGDENLMFSLPFDVEVDREGNIYVLDKMTFCVKKFDKNGKYIMTIGRKGQGPGEILESMDIELDSKGNLLVFDLQNNRISKFASDGSFLTSFKLELSPRQGAIDSEDNIYVYERWKGKLIHRYSSDGKYLFSFMDEIKIEPKRIEPHVNYLGRIAVHKDRIYLSMIYPYTIYIFDKKGVFLEKIITDVPYSQPPFLSEEGIVITNFMITGLAFSPQGYIFNKGIYFTVPSKWKEKMKKLLLVYSNIHL